MEDKAVEIRPEVAVKAPRRETTGNNRYIASIVSSARRTSIESVEGNGRMDQSPPEARIEPRPSRSSNEET